MGGAMTALWLSVNFSGAGVSRLSIVIGLTDFAGAPAGVSLTNPGISWVTRVSPEFLLFHVPISGVFCLEQVWKHSGKCWNLLFFCQLQSFLTEFPVFLEWYFCYIFGWVWEKNYFAKSEFQRDWNEILKFYFWEMLQANLFFNKVDFFWTKCNFFWWVWE